MSCSEFLLYIMIAISCFEPHVCYCVVFCILLLCLLCCLSYPINLIDGKCVSPRWIAVAADESISGHHPSLSTGSTLLSQDQHVMAALGCNQPHQMQYKNGRTLGLRLFNKNFTFTKCHLTSITGFN